MLSWSGIAQLVDNAVLNLGFGESGVDGRVKSGQVVRAGDENVLYIPVFQAIEYGSPKLGALVLPDPHTQNILPAVRVDAYGDVHCLLHNLPLVADMVVDGVQKYHCVDGLQRPLLPLLGDGQNLVRNPAHRAVRGCSPD